jgi:hypothetical protein
MGGKYYIQPRSKTMQDTSIVPFIFHPIDLTHIIKKTNKATLPPLDMQEAAA